MSHFKFLSTPGYIGDYKSAKVTIVFILQRATSTYTNIFTRVILQDKEVTKRDVTKIGSAIKINKNNSIAVLEYECAVSDAEALYYGLLKNTWTSNRCPELQIENTKLLGQRFISSFTHHREKSFLEATKGGNYILEFFDEHKQTTALLSDFDNALLLAKITPGIKEKISLDLQLIRDRIGNIVFQFPVTMVTISGKMRQGGGIDLKFDWTIPKGAMPPCFIQSESLDENAFTNYSVVPYEGQENQIIETFGYEGAVRCRISRSNPNLLLDEWFCNCPSPTGIIMHSGNDIPRTRDFFIGEEKHTIPIFYLNAAFNPVHYAEHRKRAFFMNTEAHITRYKLFKDGDHESALQYIRKLIAGSYADELLIYDPYARSKDLLNTAYFSKFYGKKIKCIGSISKHTKKTIDKTELDIAAIFSKEKAILEDDRIVKYGLDIEFRLQHGDGNKSMHDRFLLMPGNYEHLPMAYSIGTSFNSVGKSYHIITELANPALLIKVFRDHWQKLSDERFLVYKYPEIRR